MVCYGFRLKLTHFMGSVKSLSSLKKCKDTMYVAIGTPYANNSDRCLDFISRELWFINHLCKLLFFFLFFFWLSIFISTQLIFFFFFFFFSSSIIWNKCLLLQDTMPLINTACNDVGTISLVCLFTGIYF